MYKGRFLTCYGTQVAVSDALLDRLEDCKRLFPTVAVLGGAGVSCAP